MRVRAGEHTGLPYNIWFFRSWRRGGVFPARVKISILRWFVLGFVGCAGGKTLISFYTFFAAPIFLRLLKNKKSLPKSVIGTQKVVALFVVL